MKFSDEQLSLYVRDTEDLTDLWVRYADWKTEKGTPDHLPPGLIKFSIRFLTLILNRIQEHEGTSLGVALDEVTLGAILGSAFEFGQFALKHGIKVEDLTPCDCGIELTDEDIQKLLNVKNN